MAQFTEVGDTLGSMVGNVGEFDGESVGGPDVGNDCVGCGAGVGWTVPVEGAPVVGETWDTGSGVGEAVGEFDGA